MTGVVYGCTGCNKQESNDNGAVRLRGGFGTLCDPIHSGFIEVLNEGEWGSICTDQPAERRREDRLMADAVCRQLGFPHGTRIDPGRRRTAPRMTPDGSRVTEEPVERFWLSSVSCLGPEARLVDCDLGSGFLQDNEGCNSNPHRIHVACRRFPVVEALEQVTSQGAGAWQCIPAHIVV